MDRRQEDPGGAGRIGGRGESAAAAKARAQAEAEVNDEPRAARNRGPAAPPSEEPDPKAQKNFTDPESRVMKTKDGFIQG